MPAELTQQQAVAFLAELTDMLYGLTEVLLAAGRIAADTPELSPPQAMLNVLASSWESLDSQYRQVYAALYGHDPKDTHQAIGSGEEASLGTEELLRCESYYHGGGVRPPL